MVTVAKNAPLCPQCRQSHLQPTPMFLSSSPMRLDKENRQQPPSSTAYAESTGTSTSASGTTSGTDMLFKPPSYPLPSISSSTGSAAASPLVSRTTPMMLRTTSATGSSNSRERISPPSTSHKVDVALGPRSRLLEQGAVRIPNQRGPSVFEKPYRRRIVKCRRRKIESSTAAATTSYSSGTAGSNESTATWDDDASMEVDGVPDPYNTSSEHDQSSVYSLPMDLAMDTTPIRTSSPGPRRDCINPVALTLWRDGHEDWHHLNHRDRSILAARTGYQYSTSPSSWSSSSSSSHPSPHPIRWGRAEQEDAASSSTRTTSIISRPIPTRQVYSPPRPPHDP